MQSVGPRFVILRTTLRRQRREVLGVITDGTSSPGTGAVGARGVHETSVGLSHVLSLATSPSLRLHDTSGT
jgi:hypothetical protein